MLISNLLKGDLIKLTTLKELDMCILENWYNDIAFLRLFDMIAAFPKNLEQLKEIFLNEKGGRDSQVFAIRDVESEELIGIAGIENIQWNNGTALVYIGLGNDKYRGKGIGREAMRLTVDFAFKELNLYKMQLSVLSYNLPAIKLYENLGFKKEGVFREYIHRDGKRFDLYYYGLLRREWEDE